MDKRAIIKKALVDYKNITGLQAYVVKDDTIIESAREKNYFCKCLKLSSKALELCEKCSLEALSDSKEEGKEIMYSCHAGIIKWVVPFKFGEDYFAVVSEGIMVQKQKEDAKKWAKYLSEQYKLDEDMIYDNFKFVKMMEEDQVESTIQLLKDLVRYQMSMNK